MSKRKPLIVLAVLAALSSASAYAVDPAPRDAARQPMKLDTNNDGVIDRSEAAASPRLAERFDALDKNKDGKLSPDERPQHRGKHGPRHGEHMAKLDVDKDKRISREEAKADPKFAARFDAMDLNKDGFVDRADFQARAKQHRDAWFAKADTNKDGALSKAEFDAASSKRGPFGPRGHHGGRPHGDTPAAAQGAQP